ncbi:hypothetical protein QNO07_09655 [Streptomyces sp. 549]|uniref:hypothetical protein n=1 Tax=Streptomyces sp. 549 TaxID=3049076 RepID=UPI0024C45135|nr:hypothetical protein [Streptomyces sp. 549]MDK1473685.1 hypothetical protein [Streptomyces sp. 549]
MTHPQIRVHRRPGRVAIDVTDIVEQAIRDLAEVAAADPQALIDDLLEIDRLTTTAGTQTASGCDDSPAGHARDELVTELTERLSYGTQYPCTADEAMALAEHITRAVGPLAQPERKAS